jgi:simple sugar transport system permease protein
MFAFLAAMAVVAILFRSYGASPIQAYFALFHEPFGTLRGFGYTLVRAAPLALIALGTIVSWRSGFYYLGFEGCFVMGAAAAGWLSLSTFPGARIGPLPFALFLPLAILASFAAGGLWAALVALVRLLCFRTPRGFRSSFREPGGTRGF